MKQILQNLKTGATELVEVPMPGVGRGQILIRTTRTLISAGTERMLVDFGKAGYLQKARQQPDKVKQVLDKMRTDGILPTVEAVFNKLDEPMPLGYCNAGVVLEVGNGITDLQPGDRVASNGQHAEVVCVPRNLCAKIPDSVSDEEAAFTVLGSIALQGIRLAEPRLGETFVVYGLGLIGLITVQLLQASGCEVLGVDINPERLAIAEQFGARIVNGTSDGEPVAAAAGALTSGNGVDGVLITASAKSDDIVHQAAKMCRKRGRIILVGIVDLNLRRSDFYEKELTFQVSCSYGPGRYDDNYERKGQDYPLGFVRWTEQRNFEAVLGTMKAGALKVDVLITHRFPLEEASRAYEMVSGDSSALGVILEYSGKPEPVRTIRLESEKTRASGRVVAAMIGAGNFAKMTMAPALAKTSARLKYVSARTDGAAAAHIARKYGFENATSDLDAIWDDQQVNTVFIAPSHNSHAELICRALKAGKHVFVEKPLCLTMEELEQIELAAYPRRLTQTFSSGTLAGENTSSYSTAQLMLIVGFNRRFSPHVAKIREVLHSRGEPLAMNYTVNAGIIPPEAWVHDPEVGGGRIIGEACHFIDLLVFLTGSPVVSVAAFRMEKGVAVKEDKMSIALSFKDGSIGTVNYFGNGSKKYPKEILEVFSEGRVLRMDNFRKTTGFGFSGFRKFKTRRQDKGHKAGFAAFIQRIEKGGQPLIPFHEIINVTLASFAAIKSAKENRIIILGEEFPEIFKLLNKENDL